GSLTKTTPPPPHAAAPDAGDMSVAEEQPKTTTVEFPLGDEGERALGRLAPMKALRDLGPPSDGAKEEYGLSGKSDKLTVTIGGATHELLIGTKVFGGDDRYVLDPKGGHAFVVGGEVMRPFDAGDTALRERRLHKFEMKEVGRVTVKAGEHEKTMVREA